MPLRRYGFRSPYVVSLQQLGCVCCARETPVKQRSGQQGGPHLACATFEVLRVEPAQRAVEQAERPREE